MEVRRNDMSSKDWSINSEISAGKYYIRPLGQTKQYPVTITPIQETTSTSKKVNPDKEDDIERTILNDGYIENNNLYRRWIMAQMLRHYKEGLNGETSGFDHHFVTGTKYKYAWETAKNEVKALRHLTGEELKKRERFFNLDVVKNMAKEHRNRLAKTDDLRLVLSFDLAAEKIFTAKTYWDMYKALDKMMKTDLVYEDTPKPKAWKNAFKGAGAYYTMDNLIKFHGCRWKRFDGSFMTMKESLNELEKAVDENENTYYKLYAIMCDFIKYNHFDFYKRMREIYKGA